MRIFTACALLSMFVGACATPPPPPPPPPSPPPPPFAGPPPEAPLGVFEALSTMRELAGPTTFLGPIPTAVVVMKADQPARNAAFCQGYIGMPSVEEVAAGSPTAANAIPLRWLLKVEPDAESRDCPALLAGYDFTRAEQLVASLSALPEGPQMTGAGPFVIQFMPDGSAMVIDASSRTPQQVRQMAPMWLAWSGQIVPPESPDGGSGCLLASAGSSGTMAERAKAWLGCEFPDGLDVKTMRAIGCAAARMVGVVTATAARFLCEA